MINSITIDHKLMAIPKFKLNLSTYNVLSGLEIKVHRACDSLGSSSSPSISKLIPIFPEDNDPGHGKIIVLIFIFEFPLTLLVDRDDILPLGFDYHTQVN